MKKLLTFSAAALMTLGASAQSLTNIKTLTDNNDNGICVIPRELSYDGTNRIVITNGSTKNEGADQYTIYSNDFNEVKTIQNAASSTEYSTIIVEKNGEVVYSDKKTTKAIPYSVHYCNYDAGNFNDNKIYVTQKLFNSDAQYEYITLTPVVKKYLYETFTDGWWYWDSKTHEDIEFEGEGKVYTEVVMYNGLNIVSETGTVLASVSYPADFLTYGDVDIFVLEGNAYLTVGGYLNYQYGKYSDELDYAIFIYRINKGGASSLLAPVSDPIRVSVMPTLVGRDEPVTISAGENVKRDKHVRVVDMQGRVMQQGKIPAGQKSTQVNHLPHGMNFVQVMEGNQTIHTQLVIVK